LYSGRTKGKANRDGSLTKYGNTPMPIQTPKYASDPEVETVLNKALQRDFCAVDTKDI
jgi:hypothetical protein